MSDVFLNSSSQQHQKMTFSSIMLGVASPDEILANSSGEVRTHETINYRTFKPERDGLFCAKIFGPIKDYECLCGKYRRIKYKGIVCDKCEVMVTLSKVRRERMGHIDLVTPVVHTWFLRSQPSRIATILGTMMKDVDRVANYQAYIVIDSGSSTLSKFEVLSDDEYFTFIDQFGDNVAKFGTGGEGIREALISIEIDEEVEKMHILLQSTKSVSKIKSIEKRLNLFKDFQKSGNKPEWMVLTRISVLPPDLRPLVMLDGGKFASSDLNELYRRVINRNNRLRRLVAIGAPEMIIKNEKRMLQSSVDDLIMGGAATKMKYANSMKSPRSLSDGLKGKNGRFRQNLLGKRVDYSGRSVITVGPNLKLHECGIPKTMALELFKPFIFSKLMMYGMVGSIKIAKRLVESGTPEVIEVLESIVKEYVVLLNRAPTLHRLGIQAFEVRLIEGKAIQLHPLVCKAFNADFDGDQMAVHVPISIESQLEARVLMLSSNNILSPADGSPVITPTKDIVLGLYYATSIFESDSGSGMVFDSFDDLRTAIQSGAITYNSKILFKLKYSNHLVETCAGRLFVYEVASPDQQVDFTLFNQVITSKIMSKIVLSVFDTLGQKATVVFCDKVMAIGFKMCTVSGVSFGKNDIIIPRIKNELVEASFGVVKDADDQYRAGYITKKERYNLVTDEWAKCADEVTKHMMVDIAQGKDTRDVNSVFMMIDSGARGSQVQLRQMAAMRGLMVKPSGEVIENPIISNFKEGLSVIEYFNSTHGSRKGVADTALRTADAGYLTRRLVDVAQNYVITEYDCGTMDGLFFKPVVVDGKLIESLSSMLFGRVLAEDLVRDGDVVLPRNTVISAENADIIDKFPIVKVRSVAKCETFNGVCAMCYGLDISKRNIVSTGEAVGIVAAQSIGEPGTQLTLRTFQIGGVSLRSASGNVVIASEDGVVDTSHISTVVTDSKDLISISGNGKIFVKDSDGRAVSEYNIPYGSNVLVKHGSKIKVGDKISTCDSYVTPVISEYNGYVKFVDMIPGASYRENLDDLTGMSNKVVTDWMQKYKYLLPRLAIVDKNGNPVLNDMGREVFYLLPQGTVISVNDGDEVRVGMNLARIQRESYSVGDITGGLPIVESVFEARIPSKPAIISPSDGIVAIDYSQKLKVKISIIPSDSTKNTLEYFVKKDRKIKVNDGSRVEKGDIIVDGNIDIHDVLHSSGTDEAIHAILNKIQSVYKLQGMKIDNKHIELITRGMLGKVSILDGGDSGFGEGDVVTYDVIRKLNAELSAVGKSPAQFNRILLGITKASIATDSFISAAAFQEVVKVLVSAAVSGKKDNLIGCKENVIVGRLIPAGTGLITNKLSDSNYDNA